MIRSKMTIFPKKFFFFFFSSSSPSFLKTTMTRTMVIEFCFSGLLPPPKKTTRKKKKKKKTSLVLFFISVLYIRCEMLSLSLCCNEFFVEKALQKQNKGADTFEKFKFFTRFWCMCARCVILECFLRRFLYNAYDTRAR